MLKFASVEGTMDIGTRIKLIYEDKKTNVISESIKFTEFKSQRYNSQLADVHLSQFSYLVFKMKYKEKTVNDCELFFTYNSIYLFKNVINELYDDIMKGACFIEDTSSGRITSNAKKYIKSFRTASENFSCSIYPDVFYADENIANYSLGVSFVPSETGVPFFISFEDFETLYFFLKEYNLTLSSQIAMTSYLAMRPELEESV